VRIALTGENLAFKKPRVARTVSEMEIFKQSSVTRADKVVTIQLPAMRMLWCWRCKAEMPMLDDDEYRRVISRPTNERGKNLQERFATMLAEYERITGFRETNPNAIWHHRLSIYGPPCRVCGKPLRTPLAKVCGACMKPVADSPSPTDGQRIMKERPASED
jgi:hypothetical protein